MTALAILVADDCGNQEQKTLDADALGVKYCL